VIIRYYKGDLDMVQQDVENLIKENFPSAKVTIYPIAEGFLDLRSFHVEARFPNNYAASIVMLNGYSLSGLELAIIRFSNGEEREIAYDTPVANDIVRGLTPEVLKSTLMEISALPEAL
jgi:hypothetical protein